MIDSNIKTIIDYQSEYFSILYEFFISVTGQTPKDFCEPNKFVDAIRLMGKRLRGNEYQLKKSEKAFRDLSDRLSKFYAQNTINCFAAVKKIDCFKVHLGGSSKFLETQLNATRKSILFSDIVLIPDPVLPWFESKRRYEKLNLSSIIEAAYFTLQLKSMVTDDETLPPFLIFPSFEKALEENDEITINATNQLVADFFSFYIDKNIKSVGDIPDFIQSDERAFLERVEASKLFVSPGGEVGEPIQQSLKNYIEYAKTRRSDEFNRVLESSSNGNIAMGAIMERLSPQYHLFENSYELRSNPLLCIDAQAHYFRLCSRMTTQRVLDLNQVDTHVQSLLAGLMNKRLDFLSNIDDEQLAFLRRTNENFEFRRKLQEFLKTLPETSLNDLGIVASEICSYVETSISQHEKEIEVLKGKYAEKHTATLGSSVIGLAVTMVPALAPFLGTVVPIALAGKYAKDKLAERREKKNLSGSMMGIFALAKDKS